jgi:excinuclease UvrABC nuclease subunit
LLQFELAAFYRDRLQGIAATIEKQYIVSDRFDNRGMLGIYREEEWTEFAVSERRGESYWIGRCFAKNPSGHFYWRPPMNRGI